MSTQQRQAASESIKAIYMDFDGLFKLTLKSVPNEFTLFSFANSACQHLTSFTDSNNQSFLLMNNHEDNIQVLKLNSNSKHESSAQAHQVIDILSKGFACSAVKGNKMYIGCSNGTLLEMNCKSLKIEREMNNDMPIQSIMVMDNDLIVLAHSVSSGYMEDRSSISIVKPGSDYTFECLVKQSLKGTGDINQIILNSIEESELILAC